jgi:AraC-like DNA-binding protein
VDVLTDSLATLQLRSSVYFQADFGAPWGMDIKGGAVANFHLVVRGRCWLRVPGSTELRELNQGDIVVLAHGDRHALLDSPDTDVLPADVVLGRQADDRSDDDQSVDGQSADDRSVDGQSVDQEQRPDYGGDGKVTTLICGHYEYDRAGSHPLLLALPTLIHLRSEKQNEWVSTASQLTVQESGSSEEGSLAVVNRLAEILLIQVIRAYSKTLVNKTGFLAALSEPTIAAALLLFHQQPARSWQLPELASDCGVSRTILVDRFRQVLGVAPMHYLRELRMHKARTALLRNSDSIAQVAESVGYTSEWSFSKAYKRVFSEGPGATRKSAMHRRGP